jgi:hypothetical protein
VRVVVRPWVRARIESSTPVEFRAFVAANGIAVSNYHRRRPLSDAYESIARQVLTLTERLAKNTSLATFSADFLLDDSGRLLFLEGGLGYDGGRLVDVCCFDSPPNSGQIALAPTRK